MLNALAKLRYPVVLCIVGVIFILLSFYSVSGSIKQPQLALLAKPNKIMLIIGILSLGLSLFAFLIDLDILDWLSWSRLTKTETGLLTTFRSTKIYVDFGLLENIYKPSEKTAAVVLPVNEFFDNACFADIKTATGAFLGKYSVGASDALRKVVEDGMATWEPDRVEKEAGTWAKSYGTGKCLYLDQPLALPLRIILASVASKRAGEGLRSELRYLYNAMHETQRIVADNRLDSLYVPLLGAGKGGVPADVACVTLLIAAFEIICKPSGHALKEIHIIIYSPTKGQEQIPRNRVKRVFKRVQSIYNAAVC